MANQLMRRLLPIAFFLLASAHIYADAQLKSTWQVMAERTQEMLTPTEVDIDNKLIQTYHGYPGVWTTSGANVALKSLCREDLCEMALFKQINELAADQKYLRSSGYGSAGARNVVAFLAQDAGYALYYDGSGAQTASYSVAMIQNQGDGVFPIDSCDYDNCGIRNRANAHRGEANVFSICPAGGSHGSRGYAQWDAWVISAVKRMLHDQRGAPTFTGYAGPAVATSNACM
jgi:hypothetical protein